MSIRHVAHSAVVVALLAVLGVTYSFAQADPEWLKSWNEADQHRPAELSATSRIAAKDEPGVPLIVRGKVLTPSGKSAAGVIVHSYHRDHEGFEFGAKDTELTTWELQGWAKTDTNGRFEFHTIRPAVDYLGREPAHIHFTVESAKFGRQWAPKLHIAEGKRESAGVLEAAGEIETVEITIRLKEQADF